MRVKTFDEKKLSKLLKECDPELLLYIKTLTKNSARWQDIAQKAIKKLKRKEH